MSLTPITPVPDFSTKLKSFWQRPEGKVGLAVLLATAIAGLYGSALILPWLILLLSNTITAIELGAALFAILYIITNRNFRAIVKNVFQSSMRFLTSLVITVDPIGIEENYLDDMTEAKAKLDRGVEGCAGAKQGLETNISKNNSAIKHNQSLLDEVKRRSDKTTNPLQLRGYEFDKQRYLQDIGRKMSTNANLQKTLDLTNNLYSMFQRMQQLADYNIANLTAQIENDKDERNAILEAYKALSPAQKLIRGEPEALKMFNASREYLAEDNAKKLGAMKDFSAISDKYMRGMDIEQGAAAADAEKMLAELEAPMMLTAGTETVPAIMPKDSDPVTVEAKKTSRDSRDSKFPD